MRISDLACSIAIHALLLLLIRTEEPARPAWFPVSVNKSPAKRPQYRTAARGRTFTDGAGTDEVHAVAPPESYAEGVTARNPGPMYPTEARERGLEGTVLVRLELSENAESVTKLTNVSIAKSSGAAELDQAALLAVKDWFFPRLPSAAKHAFLLVPFTFRLSR